MSGNNKPAGFRGWADGLVDRLGSGIAGFELGALEVFRELQEGGVRGTAARDGDVPPEDRTTAGLNQETVAERARQFSSHAGQAPSTPPTSSPPARPAPLAAEPPSPLVQDFAEYVAERPNRAGVTQVVDLGQVANRARPLKQPPIKKLVAAGGIVAAALGVGGVLATRTCLNHADSEKIRPFLVDESGAARTSLGRNDVMSLGIGLQNLTLEGKKPEFILPIANTKGATDKIRVTLAGDELIHQVPGRQAIAYNCKTGKVRRSDELIRANRHSGFLGDDAPKGPSTGPFSLTR